MQNDKDIDTMIVLDADKTLAPVDTGEMFWKRLALMKGENDTPSPIKAHFHKFGQTREAFWQATLLYENAVDEAMYEEICEKVAGEVVMYPEFVTLLKDIDKSAHTCAVVVTCGLRKAWEKVLRRHGFHNNVKVIGGGRLSDGCVISADIKTKLVSRLQQRYNLYVWAVGDSPLDLGMMITADRAVVVVGEEGARSTTMDAKLSEAIESAGLRAQQVVLPPTAAHRLDTKVLPVTNMGQIIHSVVGCHQVRDDRIYQATDFNAAKLLMTPTRNADNQGPSLRQSHHTVGWYLATHFLGDIMGLEEYNIPHVQGNVTTGFRFGHEKDTLIVALMRAGEPLADGVNSALPLAAFLHAKKAEDVTSDYIKGRRYIILVDGVVNSGATVVDFVRQIRKLNRSVRIIVVSGVTQAKAVVEGEFSCFKKDGRLSLVTLRMSENKYKGKGGTDTGHRLFNTTFLE
jgi:uracil phosphoribosyltransferase/phosphoserine phosphatase